MKVETILERPRYYQVITDRGETYYRFAAFDWWHVPGSDSDGKNMEYVEESAELEAQFQMHMHEDGENYI